MRHFYSTCVLALDGNDEPHVLLTTYLPGHQKRCATLVPEGLNMLMKSLVGGGGIRRVQLVAMVMVQTTYSQLSAGFQKKREIGDDAN